MKRITTLCIALLCILLSAAAQEKVVKLKVIETSDVHGNYYPYNFITQRPWDGSLARVYSYVQEQRRQYGDNLLLLDNGDILQGQPTAYYYNYIDTVSTHLCAAMLNYMKYDAGNMGNHDVETGHAVYDRWVRQCRFPILGANIVRTADGKPYLPPYKVIERDGVKIVVIGMITPAIPAWLSENLWQGLRFDDMVETARHWVPIIQEKEHPDVLLGLFHSGLEGHLMLGKYDENASLEVAQKVPGFDAVLIGHDHTRHCLKTLNTTGDSVLVIDPANNARVVADVDITLHLKDGKLTSKEVAGKLTPMKDIPASAEFMKEFAPQYKAVEKFVSTPIGTFEEGISTRPAYFGPSAFIDFIHTLQLSITKADVSFAAPLSFDAEIPKGTIRVSDMFNLYKFENMLYTMRLSGQEIKGYLEMSYALWTNQMKSPDDHLLLFSDTPGKGFPLQNASFNFDSAAGIIYTVDVTKPAGEKVHIVSMADGTPFLPNHIYKVAVNSYRGNGGGELLTKGAGIPKAELQERIVFSTDKDLRYYLMEYIKKQGRMNPKALNQWKFIPENWTVPASQRDYKLLFRD
ncbi:MAG: bifunctional metallophosphatase/5'-nucleotidase [Mediterranea sp.]|jgi:2',3'-cyclic-nucleotide 2'-phosphodiesterase/3'-nucleotidase|nr:bifunctional metallophosphatase/5'-nucleotidase [Mediterranea sp.]